MTKNPQELAKERYARLSAAINLQTPDRVPVWGIGGDVVAEYGGITQKELTYDYEKSLGAIKKFNGDFQFDTAGAYIPGLDGRIFNIAFSGFDDISSSSTFITGPMHDVLNDKYYRYPGNEISEDSSPQFTGGCFMEADEYDQLIKDPTGFIANTILPRACNNLSSPRQAMATWARYGMEIGRFYAALGQMGQITAEQGYASMPQGGAYTPLDLIGDFMRGINNTVLDIRRYPDKVKEATEALVEPILTYALSYKKLGFDFVMIPLHLNEYLSPKLYKEFYWGPLKKIILKLLDEGIKSQIFFEGHHEPHLETILELPKGWGIAYFEKTDILKAREVLKDNCCVAGGLPISLVIGGTPEKIDSYIKELFEKVKPNGGGFILAAGVSAAPRDTPVENLHAVIKAVEKYGWY